MVAVTEQVVIQQTLEESSKERKQRLKAEKQAQQQRERDEKLARYKRLRANVRRRRVFYWFLILLAIATLVATLWDIIFNDSDWQWFLLPVYVALFILGIFALISRKRHLEEVNEIKALERTWLECDNCRSVFQFGQEALNARRHVGFTCPVCGDESALPLPGAEPVERSLPPGRLEEVNYLCGNCKEDIVIGVYGGRPRDVDFRACPKCGVTGQIRLNVLG